MITMNQSMEFLFRTGECNSEEKASYPDNSHFLIKNSKLRMYNFVARNNLALNFATVCFISMQFLSYSAVVSRLFTGDDMTGNAT